MKRLITSASLAAVLVAIALAAAIRAEDSSPSTNDAPTTAKTAQATATTIDSSHSDFFDAIDAGQIAVKLIVMNDHAARLIVTNTTNQPVSLKMPEAFAGVPIVAQLGGAGGARAGGGTRGSSRSGNSNTQQSVGGGGGGIGGGLGGGGGGGGFFSIPPEKTEKLDYEVLCLNHGLRDPSSATPYKIVPADAVVDRPAVVELLKAFGRGELKHNGAQAAAWHLNNDLSWDEIKAMLQGTKRSFRRPPYFTPEEVRQAMAYANTAMQLADTNAAEYQRAKKSKAEKAKKLQASDKLSTTDSASKEPSLVDASDKKDAAHPAVDKK